MPTLAIDTATETLSVALGEGNHILADAGMKAGRAHLELLLPEIELLLGRCSLRIRDVDHIVVGTGPGTFSGLRVGISTGRALAQALDIPISGSSSLQALALRMAPALAEGEDGLLPLIDARRGQVFTRLYRLGDGDIPEPASDIACLGPEHIGRLWATEVTGRLLAGGDGALAYHQRLDDVGGRLRLLAADDPRNIINASCHIRLTGPGGAEHHQGMDTALPVYIREPDADRTILLRKRLPWLT